MKATPIPPRFRTRLAAAKDKAFKAEISGHCARGVFDLILASEDLGYAKALARGRHAEEIKDAGNAISRAMDKVVRRCGHDPRLLSAARKIR